jgi:lipoteichoic acid synthase
MRKLHPLMFKTIIVLLYLLSIFFVYQPLLVNTAFERWTLITWAFISMSLFWFLPIFLQSLLSIMSLSMFALDAWIQDVYYRAFGQFGRLSTLISSQAELIESMDSVKAFFQIDDFRYLWIVLLYAFILMLLMKFISMVKINRFWMIILFMSMISVATFSQYRFNRALLNDKLSVDGFQYYKSIDYIYETVPNTLAYVENFGILSLLQKDIYELWIKPVSNNIVQENEDISVFLSEQSTYLGSDVTGVFEGKSVLMIEAESLIQGAISPILTPTLYRLQNSGYTFTNYNSPLLAGSTSDTELMANTSLLPVNTGENTFMNYADQSYPVSLATVFSENGYTSMAAHNNYAEFYNRDEMLPLLGYDFFDSYRMGFEGQMIPDSEFIVPIKWISFEREKFFSYWITFNGHQPYTLDEMSPLFYNDYEWVESLYPNLPETEKVYLAKIMDFDRALGSLIIDFTNGGRIEDLVLIIFGDHYAKGAFSDPAVVSDICDLEINECVRTPLIIWNNDQFTGSNDIISNPLDILPTTFDLMGFEYEQSFVLGHSLFDPSYEGFYFNAFGDLVFNEGTYNITSNEWTSKLNIPFENVQTKVQIAIEEMRLGSLIIENNYFESSSFIETFSYSD